ncbi:Sua5/YciO/YrdC/YwlC family protein [Aquibium sp. A9E412]|uniref:Sua5/YciO/YrdC/YwlC family protein n=1 Tax=Aquibium sp. A9E412 TaxID=2976767 RepID=UPI0025B12605|nr:Sua5/YciO/YrdC/YwlC family protein [Aquibium sp. A9E412]MDN2568319.1 Sua5/YciO/YrdC/YwlC family protein [Aquibium sp. A9E412]
MAEETSGSEPTTADPVDPDRLSADVARVLDRLAGGGVAILPLDVAYAVVAAREAGIRRIFAAKRRSYDKPSGLFGDWRLSRELHVMDDDRHAMVRTIVQEEGLPFSVVAPFRADHPLIAGVDPFVLASSTKAGTLDMLLNAGQAHDAVARQSRERAMPVFGSSANTSLAGSKYRFADIEDEVRRAADIHLDHGRSKYANEAGRSSTIIDFRDFTVIRVGVCFDRLADAFSRRFGVALTMTERTAR